MRRLVLTRLPALVAVLAVLGCGTIHDAAAPTCTQKGPDTLVLMAQSVPTASRVPCIASYPAGWHFASVDVQKGKSEFLLNSDRAGTSAVRVVLERECTTENATQIPSDEPETRRFERILSVRGGFHAVRTYRFDGGCATYEFNFKQPGRALVNEASVALGFVTRAELGERVRESSDGSLKL